MNSTQLIQPECHDLAVCGTIFKDHWTTRRTTLITLLASKGRSHKLPQTCMRSLACRGRLPLHAFLLEHSSAAYFPQTPHPTSIQDPKSPHRARPVIRPMPVRASAIPIPPSPSLACRGRLPLHAFLLECCILHKHTAPLLLPHKNHPEPTITINMEQCSLFLPLLRGAGPMALMLWLNG
jgi:hypothetical protein